MDACLKKLLIHTIEVASVTGYKVGGGEALGDWREMAAYIEVGDRRQASPDGSLRVNVTVIYTEEEITYDDRVRLPGAPSDKTFKPDLVLKYDDVTTGGISHYETELA